MQFTKKQYKDYWQNRAKEQGALTVTHSAYLREKNPVAKINSITEEWWKLFKPHFSEINIGKTVMDFGCGRGRFTHRFIELGFSSIVGLDMTEELLTLAQENHHNTPELVYVLFNGETIPFDDNHFDVIFTCTVLQHIVISDVFHKVIKEIGRVLKPGGMLLSFEGCGKNKGNPAVRLRSFEEWRNALSIVDLKFINTYTEMSDSPTHILMKGIK